MATKKINLVSKLLPEFLLLSGILLVTLSLAHFILRTRSLSIDEEVVAKYLETPVVSDNRSSYPVHISIPWTLDVGIDPQVYQDGKWTIAKDKASYLVASALPGQAGNIIIYGHNTREILGNIRALKGKEKITLTLRDGTTRLYQVTTIAEVSPGNPALLTQTQSETLTLYTCSGLLDSQRFVVRAVPVTQSL